MSRIFAIILGILVTLLSGDLGAQSRDWGKIWLQGSADIFTTTFSTGATPINQIHYPRSSLYFSHGNSNICDSAGGLTLVSDGYNIYDGNLNPIEDGDSIVPKLLYEHELGWSSYAQSSIILPFSNGKYRMITPTASDSEVLNYWWNHPEKGRALFHLLLYDEIDMNANGGAGKVTKRMVPLLEKVNLSKTQMMACRHGDGKSWWVVKQASDTNMVYKFLFTEEKIYGPYIQGFSEPHFTNRDVCGQAMFSSDGTKYATAIQRGGKVFVADFDRCSGMLSNPRVIDVPYTFTQNPTDPTERDSTTVGLCFSPNGRFLYVNGFYTVRQCDLQDSNSNTAWTMLNGPDTTWQQFQWYSNTYPGPDGKLYIGNWGGLGGQMSVIENPNAKGAAAGFCAKCLRFPGIFFLGVTRFFGTSSVPCMPNYTLGATNPICYPAGINNTPTAGVVVTVYPNPAHGTIMVTCLSSGTLTLYNYLGQVVSSSNLPDTKTSIDVQHLPAGVYTYKYANKAGMTMTDKLVLY